MTKTALALLSPLLLALNATAALGQALPAAVASPTYEGFSIPALQGSLRYSLTASEAVDIGFNGTNATSSSTNVSGNLAYIAPSTVFPFSAVESAGYLAYTTGQPSSFFDRLQVTQGFVRKKWSLNLSDGFGYLPQAPSEGLSGVPGVGDLGVSTGTTPTASELVLTPYGTRLDNSATLTGSVQLSGTTSLNGTAALTNLRFLSNVVPSGADSNQISASGGISHRLDVRNTLGANYTYSRFSYIGVPGLFSSQGANLSYTRLWTRKVSSSFSFGPQGTSTNIAGSATSFNFAASASLTYTAGHSNLSASYSHGTNGGSGVSLGARSDNLNANASRQIGRSLHGSVSIGYSRSIAIDAVSVNSLATQSIVAGAQASRALTRNLSAYTSYTVETQSFQGTSQALTPFSGLSQILGFGITYSPAVIRIGHP
jgi:hypothetical protein